MTVEDPEVIDITALGPDEETQVTLIAVEGRPLRDDSEQLSQIDTKLQVYLWALESDQIAEAPGRFVTLQLQVPNEPRTPRARELLSRLHDVCLDRGLGFNVLVHQYPDNYADLVGLTEEERHFFDPVVDPEPPFPVIRTPYTEEELAALEAERPSLAAIVGELRSSVGGSTQENPGESRLDRFRRLLGGRDGRKQ